MNTVKLRFTGLRPLLQHNGALVDPFNPIVKAKKALTSKRKKTDSDMLEVSRLEFLGSLYLNSARQVIVPDYLLEATIVSGAKKSKSGQQAKAGVFVTDAEPLLNYGEQLTPEQLWNDGEGQYVNKARVCMQKASVMRYRPMFRNWSVTFTVEYMPDVVSEADVTEFCRAAGQTVGLGDWRPKYGRFVAEKV